MCCSLKNTRMVQKTVRTLLASPFPSSSSHTCAEEQRMDVVRPLDKAAGTSKRSCPAEGVEEVRQFQSRTCDDSCTWRLAASVAADDSTGAKSQQTQDMRQPSRAPSLSEQLGGNCVRAGTF